MFRYSTRYSLRSYYRRFGVVRKENENALVETATRMWVNDFVISHKLCPWAAGVWNNNEVKVVVFSRKPDEVDDEEYLVDIAEECCKEALELINDDDLYSASLIAQDIEYDVEDHSDDMVDHFNSDIVTEAEIEAKPA